MARRTKIMIKPEKENSQISYEKYFSTSIKIWTPASANLIFKFKIQEYEILEGFEIVLKIFNGTCLTLKRSDFFNLG